MRTGMGNEIREMNLSYLMLAQQMLQSDRVGAMLKLGVGEDVAELIENLTPAQILRMASCDMLLCRFRFDDNLLVGLLSNHGADSMVSRLHATILAAGKPVEHLA